MRHKGFIYYKRLQSYEVHKPLDHISLVDISTITSRTFINTALNLTERKEGDEGKEGIDEVTTPERGGGCDVAKYEARKKAEWGSSNFDRQPSAAVVGALNISWYRP